MKRDELNDYCRFHEIGPPSPGLFDGPSLGYIYVIGFEEAGVVKIGSAIFPAGRMRELQCGNPFELQLKACVSIYEGNATLIEFATHKLAAAHHIRGEWFELDVEDAVRFIVKAARNAKAKFGAPTATWERLQAAAMEARPIEEARLEEERRARLRQKLGMD